MLIEKKIRQYIERHPLTPETLRDAKKLNEVLGDWFVYLVEELGEQQQQLASKDDLKSLATKDDLRLVIELMEKRFEAQQKEMHTRFEAIQKKPTPCDKKCTPDLGEANTKGNQRSATRNERPI